MGKKNRRRAAARNRRGSETSSIEIPTTTGDVLRKMLEVNNMPSQPEPPGLPPMSPAGRDSLPNAENMSLLNRMSNKNRLPVQQELIRQLLVNIGVDVNANDADRFGDGDQSIILAPQCFEENYVYKFEYQDVMYEIKMRAADIRQCLEIALARTRDIGANSERRDDGGLSELSLACVQGKAKLAERLILKSAPGSEARKQILAKRETSLRYTPLSITAVIPAKYVSIKGAKSSDYIDVVKVLIKYGANPYARDIEGNTAVHHATDSSLISSPVPSAESLLEIADICIRGSKFHSYFGNQVLLERLSKNELNGLQGVCGGFDVDTGRLVVYLDKSRTLLIKPENVRLCDSGDEAKRRPTQRLVDVQNRTGGTALYAAVVNGTRSDIVAFLLKHRADIDISHHSDKFKMMSPRSIATAVIPLTRADVTSAQPAHNVIREHISKLKKKASRQQEKQELCGKCHEEVGKDGFLCSKCLITCYCSSGCQKKHWEVHRAVCKQIRSYNGIRLGLRSKDEEELALFVYNRVERTELDALPGGYHPPDGVKAGENFVLKCRAVLTKWLIFFDRSRSCCFIMFKESESFQDIYKLVDPILLDKCIKAKEGENVESYEAEFHILALTEIKSKHFWASFDKSGCCTIHKQAAVQKSF